MRYSLCELPPPYDEKSVLKMLRFDPSGAIHPEYGVTQDQLDDLHPKLEELRQELVADPPAFYLLPNQQLDAYKQHREASELGRIFKVANSQMDVVDAVVVLGSGSDYWGPRALMDACCDPYHNQLRRGPRGGKPRMFFAGYGFDNDTAQALLSLISAGGYSDSEIERRWTLVAIDQEGALLEAAATVEPFLEKLTASLQGDDAQMIRRLFVPIARPEGYLRDVAGSLDCEEVFAASNDFPARFQMMSSIAMLPAAMVGLDINKLLEGAVAMNEHFASTPSAKNIVLQYVAINHLLETHRNQTVRAMVCWTDALETVGHWYDQLVSGTLNQHELGPTAQTFVNPRDLHGRYLRHLQGSSNGISHHLKLEKFRTDRLKIDLARFQGVTNHPAMTGDATETDFVTMMSLSSRLANEALHADQRPSTELVLPNLDTFMLGQLFQMFMIATVLEAKLLGLDPYAPPTNHLSRFELNQPLRTN
jgi:glucose-6-phosphate isomerase